MHSCKLPLIVVILLSATVAFASITGTISGIVTDPAGAVVSGADVTATNVQTGVAHTVKTDAKGFYSFLALPIGTYTITVHREGFKDFQQKQIVIDANSAVRADAAMASRGSPAASQRLQHRSTRRNHEHSNGGGDYWLVHDLDSTEREVLYRPFGTSAWRGAAIYRRI